MFKLFRAYSLASVSVCGLKIKLKLMNRLQINYQWSDCFRMAGLAVTYALLARLVLTFSTANGNVTIFWIPGGLALAALLLWGARFWPAVFIGALSVGLMVDDPFGVSVLLALGNTLESLVAVELLRRMSDFDTALTKPADVLKIALVGAASAIISALIGPLTLLTSGYLTTHTVANNILHWWQADTIGILLGTPLLLIWRQWPYDWFSRQRILFTCGFFLLAFLTGLIIFLGRFADSVGFFAQGHWMFLFVVWAAVQFGQHGVLLIIVITVIQGLLGATQGIGFFATDIAQTGLQNFWFYILALTVTGMTLAVVINQRTQAQALLKKSEQMLKAVFESTQDGIAVADTESLRFVYFNQSICRMLGYNLEEFNNLLVSDLHHVNDLPRIKAEIDQLRQGKAGLIPELPFKRKDGSTVYADDSASTVELAGRVYIMGVFRDVTERKQHEEQIHRLTQAYAALAETNRVARRADSETELFEAVCRIAVEHGGMKMAWIGMTAGSDLIQPVASYGAHVDYLDDLVVSVRPDKPEGCGPTGTALREGRGVVLQDFATSSLTKPWQSRAHSKGNWHASAALPILRWDQPYAVLTIYHDDENAFDELIISLLNAMVADIGFTLDVLDKDAARRIAMDALRESEQRYRTLSDLIPDQIWTSRPDGCLDYVNQRVLDYFGRSKEAMIEDNWRTLVHPEDLPKTLQVWSMALQTGQLYETEFRLLHHSGEYRWCVAKALPARDKQGNIVKWYGINSDITERKKIEEKLRLTAQVFESTLEGIIITDAQRVIIDVNAAFVQITGYSRQESIGKKPSFLKSGHQEETFYATMWQAINNTGHWNGELWNRHKDGTVYPIWTTISALTNDQGVVTHYVGISSDITLLKQHEKQLEFIAHYDALTGIPNRVLLVDRMQQALAQTRREQKLLAICYLDLDGFKPINDTQGHDAGDRVLIEIAGRIGRSLRGGDTVARLGGDEFVILLLGIDNPNDCHISLDRLLQGIENPINIQGQSFRVTASIGVTLYPLDDQDPDTLLRHADQAMYMAKQRGKNRYHMFDPHEDMRLRINHAQGLRLQQGLEDKEFELFYQPKVALDSYRVMGAEALIRWRHPERGLLPPAEFLPLIDNFELEIQVGEWVIDTALAQMEYWRHEGLELDVSINIAAAHLQTDCFVESLKQKLAQHPKVQPHQLQIEILETAALADISTVTGIIDACAGLGVRFALDDFGTGYSSLSYLRRLPADTLKIDQSFVRDMLIDQGDCAIVEGVIALAHTFKRMTVAEGVETSEHFQTLRQMGCDIGQGYGIARPMPAGEIMSWCHAFTKPALL